MELKRKSDDELLELWQKGNEIAFNVLFNRYFSKLYYYISKKSSNKLLAEEIIMDVMLSVWQKKHLLHTGISISGYLYTSARNRLIDHFRKQTIATVALEDACYDYASSLRADTAIYEKEMESKYKFIVKQLPPRKQEIFRMSREEGYTYQQIANTLQLSKNTIENHMVAALRMMRTYVAAS